MSPQDALRALAGPSATAWGFSVPCSVLAPLLASAEGEWAGRMITLSNEGEAVAAAFGAASGGAQAVVFLQNSGLGNAVSPLTSLTTTYQAPCTLVIGYRGAPGRDDEPQHRLMGQLTRSILAGIGFTLFELEDATTADELRQWLDSTPACLRAVLVHRGAFEVSAPHSATTTEVNAPQPSEVIEAVHRASAEGTVVLASTGLLGRELAASTPRGPSLSMVGSMGCAASIGLGLAYSAGGHTRPTRVVVIDGDGALSMRLEALIAVGHAMPPNVRLDHVLVDNGTHETTGGQRRTGPAPDFVRVASACNYNSADNRDLAGLEAALAEPDGYGTARFHRIQVAERRRPPAPRPTLSPEESLRRFRADLEEVGAR